MPFSMASLITGFHDFGLIPPDVNTPKRRTLAPIDLALSILSIIGISFCIIETSESFLPAKTESTTHTISLLRYLRALIPIFP